MSIQTIAETIAVVAVLAAPIAAQTLSKPPAAATITAEQAAGAVVSACAVSLQGDRPVLSATMTMAAPAAGAGGAPHVRLGGDFAIGAAPAGGAPTVQAMAINTKGTGTNNGRAAPASCDARPSPTMTMTGTMRASQPVASCTLSGSGDTIVASVSVPLSAFGGDGQAFRGHVTLMKRGDGTALALSAEGWSAPVVVATCAAADSRKTGYDLAVAKKV